MIRVLRVLFAGLAALAMAGSTWAQTYPARAVRIIVPAAAGGPDVVARIVAAKLTEQMGQTFFVENHPGANGIVGADMVAKAAPDGYTLMVYSSGLISNKSLYKKLPYDTDKDFAPISNLVDNGGLFITVNPAVPAKTLKELIDLAKQPGSHLAYSTPGVGNTWHVATEVFTHYAGIKMTHVPYKGGGPAAAALASGEVQVLLSSPAPVMQYAKNGKARVLAYTASKRSPALPDVPTTAEAGLPSFQMDGGWFGMFAPAGTPTAVIDRLNKEVRTVLADPAVVKRFQGLGVTSAPTTPEEFRKFLTEETAKYADWVRLAGVQLD
ncbi:MAG TPA: tripartite tricarboxylate transporter substrate binding protein [Burkholderiales bacterium]|nr:tripartite tricarboxylate transporter substrate binding protein [Burkholderiales bacterium]